MNIKLFGRADLFSKKGGDTYQIVKTAEFLQRQGLFAEIVTDVARITSKPSAIIHCFNLLFAPEHLVLIKKARKTGIPIVLTPVYYPLDHYNRSGRSFPYSLLSSCSNDTIERFRAVYRVLAGSGATGQWGRQCLFGNKYLESELIGSIDRFACSSNAEIEMLTQSFPEIVRSRCRVVRNFIIPEEMTTDPGPFRSQSRVSDFVLCSGRIEDLKNQVGLIQAMRKTEIPLIFLGEQNPRHILYYRRFKELIAGSKTIFHFRNLPEQLYHSAFAAAHLHIQPSWFETIGQVSLEALYHGCHTIITRYSYLSEYFPDIVKIDPADQDQIRTSVLEAFERDRPGLLQRQRLVAGCSAEIVLPSLIAIYRELS